MERRITKVLENKDMYTLRELIESLPYSLREFGKKYDLSEVTIARLRDGKPGLRSTINKLLAALSETYSKTFTMHNVHGIIIRGEAQNREQAEEAEPDAA
jgi:predicted transcriptional regulator